MTSERVNVDELTINRRPISNTQPLWHCIIDRLEVRSLREFTICDPEIARSATYNTMP